MRHIIIALILVCSGQAFADWSLKDMNRAIEQTNFIVKEGCSGTLISVPEKLILTNYHCVDEAITSVEREVVTNVDIVKKVQVRRYADVIVSQHGYDGFTRVSTAQYITEIVAEQKKRDLAVLKIKSAIPHTYASPLLPDGDSIIKGEPVHIVGNPAGADGSLVDGVVSNMNRTFEFPWTDNEKLPMIQFSGGVYGGNSGGALYNGKGQLIGVPAAGHPVATFIGLAIPVSIIKEFMRDNCVARAFDPKADDKACRAAKDEKAKTKNKQQ